MSFEEEWPLLTDPTVESVQAEASRLSHETGTTVDTVKLVGETIKVTFRVPLIRAASLIQVLTRDSRPLTEIQSELDPPRGEFDDEAAERAGCAHRETVDGLVRVTYSNPERFTRIPDFYTLAIDVDRAEPEEEIPARVSIYSNTVDNREGWNVAFAFAGELAERLGVLPDRELD